MDEKEILNIENENEEITEEKKEAIAHLESIFEQVDAIKAEEGKDSTKAEEENAFSEGNNKTEIELITRSTPTDEEIKALEKAEDEKRIEKNKATFIKAVISIAIAAIVIFGGYFCADYMPKGASGTVVVTIPNGAGTERVARELKDNHLINSEFFFKVMSKLSRMDGKYNFGKFEIEKSSGYKNLFKVLSSPGNLMESVKVTIPEGYEIYKIADLLEEKGLIDKEKFFYLVDNGNFSYDFVSQIPKREARLEGYLFPDTYYFVPNDEYGIINEMLARFEKTYLKYKEGIENSKMTMDEIITLASIIEREAQGDADRKLVSSVFHNRIASPDYPYLQSCATVQYVLKERKPVLSTADTQIDSPYNTYINPGLPIGPIASPGDASIEAAIYPENTDYLFFVMGSDGKHHFSKTFNEHIQNKNN